MIAKQFELEDGSVMLATARKISKDVRGIEYELAILGAVQDGEGDFTSVPINHPKYRKINGCVRISTLDANTHVVLGNFIRHVKALREDKVHA